MITRTLQSKLEQLSTKYPFVMITGPRQSGKSTLAKMTFPQYKYVSFADIDIRNFAKTDPRGFIASYPDKTIIDEVQLEPSILHYLQTHTDNENREGMYILTGSQNFLLMDSVNQSLAGRIGILKLLPFSHQELNTNSLLPGTINEEIFNGCYPRLYDKKIHPTDFYPNYISTYVERDVRNIKSIGNLSAFIKLLKLCAGRIGQLLNKSSLAVECGISEPTVQSWLSILEQSYIIYLLRPEHRNFNKRLTKSPKLYFYDTGLACSLLEITSASQISSHYLRGGLFENMVINERIKRCYNAGNDANIAFWRDSHGNEVDLIEHLDGEDYIYEIKSGATANHDYFKGLTFWGNLSNIDISRRIVIYSGYNELNTSNGRLIPWKNIDNI
ncbi:MAG: ATP-binding protein [Muribaculaceae bacterium]|nr:ATP-binding protein [Muribaculaceae bacterium]